MGVGGVYEYGKRDGTSNRNDWMNQVPTAAMAFKDAGYYTAHVGKWHLGGMRQTDINERVNEGLCSHPGPNQQGFTEYISMAEGPDDHRQGSLLQRSAMLHTMGGKYLVKNDKPHPCSLPSLSDCEAQHAIRIMREAKERNESFYMHVWFEQPHGPWNIMPRFADWYGGMSKISARNRNDCYKTMVSAMDDSLGKILQALHDLDLEQDTLVLFTSDNGPENSAGTTAGFKNRKRFLHEGGIRVPAIWQWPGRIEQGAMIADFGVGVDIYPTFLEAAGISKPGHAKLDGLSLLPYLAPIYSRRRKDRDETSTLKAGLHRSLSGGLYLEESELQLERRLALNQPSVRSPVDNPSFLHLRADAKASFRQRPNLPRNRGTNFSAQYGIFSADRLLHSDLPSKHVELDLVSRVWELESRVAMWYVSFEHPVSAAAYARSFKIITDECHLPTEIYDLATDPFEEINLIRQNDYGFWRNLLNKSTERILTSKKKLFIEFDNSVSRKDKLDNLLQSVMPTLHYFSKFGNAANNLYVHKNYGIDAMPIRENVKTVKIINPDLIGKCSVPESSNDIATLPFERADHKLHQFVRPLDYY